MAKKLKLAAAAALFVLCLAADALAFCGFYVAKADTKLFNKASKVVLVRDGNRTVLTMANDFQGDPKEFAVVIPVPTFIEREQIHVASAGLIDHLDAYSAPRLVEYHDENPCAPVAMYEMMARSPQAAGAAAPARQKDGLGVTVEAEYTVGEYDIVILSAEQSSGLETWLTENGYKIPAGAGPVLGSYIKQKVRFFVARVNLKEQAKLGFKYLRPLQVAFESPKFMLPIRLGTVNADGAQELFIFALTKNGRVESTNYRTIKLPEGKEIPIYIKEEFGEFYKAMFSAQVKKDEMRGVYLEYAWDMNWCDPCAAEPLSSSELKELGVFWIDEAPVPRPGVRPFPGWQPPGAQNAFLTRLHLRYDAEHFPEDLQFQETSDKSNFQARYILRHPWTGSDSCPAADEYRKQLASRQLTEVDTLAELTGWNRDEIISKAGIRTTAGDQPGGDSSSGSDKNKWWKGIWGK